MYCGVIVELIAKLSGPDRESAKAWHYLAVIVVTAVVPLAELPR